MSRRRPLNIAIDARFTPGASGGVGQAILSLISGLAKLGDGDERYTLILGSQQQQELMRPFTAPHQSFVVLPASERAGNRASLKRPFKQAVNYIRKRLAAKTSQWPEVQISNGFFESLGCDVIHFPTQRFVVCAMPSVYNPHDLQHLHYPQFFTAAEIAKRETIYRAGCQYARTVVVGSRWIKDDVEQQYGINADKVQVIPECPALQSEVLITESKLNEVKSKYRLETPFAIYPAVAWPHKNHLMLLEALAYLRDSYGLSINLVCTGSRYEPHWPAIERRLDELKLRRQVKFLGFVSETELRALYRLSQFLIQPTLFEASSLPIFEAWLEGTPVACSNVTALPDQVMDAAWLFDPTGMEAVADAAARMATDKDLRDKLRERAYSRLRDFDSERTAKAYRAVYRRAAQFPLTEEDRWLLSWDWMRNPQGKLETCYDETTIHSGSGPLARG